MSTVGREVRFLGSTRLEDGTGGESRYKRPSAGAGPRSGSRTGVPVDECATARRCAQGPPPRGSVDPRTHFALALGLAACQKGLGVRFTTASHLVHELIEARDEKRLLRLQAQLARANLLIVDELGYVPLSQTGSELLFDVFSQRYENGATVVTSNLPFQDRSIRVESRT